MNPQEIEAPLLWGVRAEMVGATAGFEPGQEW